MSLHPVLIELARLGVWILAMFGFVAIHAIIYLMFGTGGGKGNIPDEAFEYRYRPGIVPDGAFLVDLHGHTFASDGRMTPEQFIKWHVANGYDACVLTDHNTGKHNGAFMALQDKYPGIVLVPGFEWTTDRLHMNFIGIMDYPYKVPVLNPSDEEIQLAIKQAKDLGAVVMVDHVTWTKDQPRLRSGVVEHPTREQLLDWGVDGFEISNAMYWHDPRTVVFLQRAGHEWRGRKIFAGTGTDVHDPAREWASSWTELLLDENERHSPTIEVVKRALLDGRARPWQDFDYREPPESRVAGSRRHAWASTFFAPFLGTVEGAAKVVVSKRELASYVCWLLLAYVPVRFLFLLFSLL